MESALPSTTSTEKPPDAEEDCHIYLEINGKRNPSPSTTFPKRIHASKNLKCLCIDFSDWSPKLQFTVFSLGVIGFFWLNSSLEEYMVSMLPSNIDFSFGWFLTFFEVIGFCFISSLEWSISNGEVWTHIAPFENHFYVAATMTMARGLTNISLQYLNYPTQVIFKSMKLITVMLGSVCLLKKTFTKWDYISASLLVASAVFFSLGDKDVSPRFTSFGVSIVLLSLVFDSLHANFQESLMKIHQASHLETLFWTNFFSVCCILVILIVKQEFSSAIRFLADYPLLYLLMILRAFTLYMGTSFYLLTVREFGAYIATTVTTTRKILTVVISFILFPKPFSEKYLIGFITFAGGLYCGNFEKKVERPSSPKNSLKVPGIPKSPSVSLVIPKSPSLVLIIPKSPSFVPTEPN